jgi:hypothetical protein
MRMPIDPEVKEVRFEAVLEIFQWNSNIYHPKIHELDGRKYVVGPDNTKHFLTHGCWIVRDPLYDTFTVVSESYYLSRFKALELRPMKSLTAGMTNRERRQAGLATRPRP